jgi:heat shock protein HtpX
MTSSTSGFRNTLKTAALLAVLAALLVFVGGLLAGRAGMVTALLFAIALNGFMYWKSDSLALRANGARELGLGEAPRLRQIVTDLAARAAIPVPRLYLIERPEPNAFATGRDPEHAALAVTTGILQLMDERELTGVLAHELSHVKNRDTLIGTIAATIAGAISFVAQMAQFELFFGAGGTQDRRNPLAALLTIVLAPIAATIIQLAVSRGREYSADASGAQLTGDPEGLARALEELDTATQKLGVLARLRGRVQGQAPAPSPAFAHLYIVNPLTGADLAGLFSTHPPIASRVARLHAMTLEPAA